MRICSLIIGSLLAGMLGHGVPSAHAEGRYVNETGLASGRFVWVPVDGRGPLGVVVSLSQGTVHVYSRGVETAIAAVEVTGERAKLPGGIFTISSLAQAKAKAGIVSGWRGVELFTHRGARFAEADGIVKLPAEFARLLGEVSQRGAPVIIARERSGPQVFAAPGPFESIIETGSIDRLAKFATPRIKDKAAAISQPPTGVTSGAVTSVIISRADLSAYVLRDGRVADRVPIAVEDPKQPFGLHAMMLLERGSASASARWIAFGIDDEAEADHVTHDKAADVLRRIRFLDRERTASVANELRAGAMMIVMDGHGPSATELPLVAVALMSSGDEELAKSNGNARANEAAAGNVTGGAAPAPAGEAEPRAARGGTLQPRSATSAGAKRRTGRTAGRRVGPLDNREPYPYSMYWPY